MRQQSLMFPTAKRIHERRQSSCIRYPQQDKGFEGVSCGVKQMRHLVPRNFSMRARWRAERFLRPGMISTSAKCLEVAFWFPLFVSQA